MYNPAALLVSHNLLFSEGYVQVTYLFFLSEALRTTPVLRKEKRRGASPDTLADSYPKSEGLSITSFVQSHKETQYFFKASLVHTYNGLQ